MTTAPIVELTPRPALAVSELLDGATARAAFTDHDGKSGARLEKLMIDGQPCVAKHLSLADDWIRRATGDLGCRPVLMWELGVYDALPPVIDSAVVGAAREGDDGRDGVVLMRDVAAWLVPDDDTPVSLGQHHRFIDHMAALHARFWGLDDDLGLFPLAHRVLELAPCTYEAEQAGGHDPVPPRLAAEGWARLPNVAPELAAVVLPLLSDPTPLVRACGAAPWTLIHGNWKFGNLGSGPDGRTIVLDWGENTGRAPGLFDLSWYLAINCRRLPESKDAAIDSYRSALERHGVETSGWWDAQVGLALIGGFLQLGWEKALGSFDDELAWWSSRITAAANSL